MSRDMPSLKGNKSKSVESLPLNTLILVLGMLAAVSLLGYIVISLTSGRPSAEALVGICSAIVGYLGGLLTPRTMQTR
jgi:hypothetical protein